MIKIRSRDDDGIPSWKSIEYFQKDTFDKSKIWNCVITSTSHIHTDTVTFGRKHYTIIIIRLTLDNGCKTIDQVLANNCQ